MSIDLCKGTGADAAMGLVDKITKPELSMQVGRYVLDHITGVSHFDDGFIVVEAVTKNTTPVTFQFAPDHRPFADSAIDADGYKICEDC